MLNIKFYYCKKCDNIIEVTNSKNKDVKLGKEELQELIPNTVDATVEKHVPSVKLENNKLIVDVGSIPHPMSEEHLIKAIYVVCDNDTIYRKYLTSEDKPVFEIDGFNAKHFDVYSFCNLHGLWKKSI